MAKRKRKKAPAGLPKWLTLPFHILLALVLPFFVLIRGAVALYTWFELGAWTSLGLAAVLAMGALYLYLRWLIPRYYRRKRDQEGTQRKSLRAAGLALAGFCLYGLLYISAQRAKDVQVQGEYHLVHPHLRLAVSLVGLFDQDLVITDMARVHEDYADMGLGDKPRSLHFPQSDDYVHALDLRTNGHSDFRNWLLETYFRWMGFGTLRHVGTADHLHISLMIHENPAAL